MTYADVLISDCRREDAAAHIHLLHGQGQIVRGHLARPVVATWPPRSRDDRLHACIMELGMPLSWEYGFHQVRQRTEFDSDNKEIQKSMCKKPGLLFFSKDVWKDRNNTRGSYIRSVDRDDPKRKVFCFSGVLFRRGRGCFQGPVPSPAVTRPSVLMLDQKI